MQKLALNLSSIVIISMIVSCGRQMTQSTNLVVDFAPLENAINPNSTPMNLTDFNKPQTFLLSAKTGPKHRDQRDGSLFFSKNITFKIPNEFKVKSGDFNTLSSASFSFIDVGDLSNLKKFLVGVQKETRILSQIRAVSCDYKFSDATKSFNFDKCHGDFNFLRAHSEMPANLIYLKINHKKNSLHAGEISAEIERIPDNEIEGLTQAEAEALDTIPSIDPALIDRSSQVNSQNSSSFGLTETNIGRTKILNEFRWAMIMGAVDLSNRSFYKFESIPKNNIPYIGIEKPFQFGIGYGLGSKDHTIREIPPKGVCNSYAIHALDCSGYVRQMAIMAGLTGMPIANAAVLEKAPIWNSQISTEKGFKAVPTSLKIPFENGDIVGWGDHIGIALKLTNGQISMYQSNGAAGVEKDCALNLTAKRGPRLVSMALITGAGFKGNPSARLRFMVIPKIDSLSIPTGPLAGGTEIRIQGIGFDKNVRVQIGKVETAAPQVVSEFEIIVKTPPNAKAEKLPVTVTNIVPNSPQSDVPSNTDIQFEYKDEALTIDDFAYQQSDAAALSDLNTTTGDVGTVEVEAGQYIYVFGNGLKNATFKIPGTSEILTGTTVTIPASDALFATGKDVIKIQIPTSVSPGFSGPINTSKTTEGVTTQANSTRQIQIKSVGDYSVFTYFNVQKNIPSELSTNENCLLYSKVPDFYVLYSVSKLTINKGSDAGNSYLFKDYAGAVCTAGGGWENITLKNFTPASIDSKENYSLILRVQTEGDPAAEEAIYGKSKVTSVTQRVAKPEMCDSEITNVDYLLARHLLHKCEYDPMTDSWPCERTWTDWTTIRDGTPRLRTISNDCDVNFIEEFKAKALQQSLDRI